MKIEIEVSDKFVKMMGGKQRTQDLLEAVFHLSEKLVDGIEHIE